MSDHLITVSNIQTIVTAIKNKLTALAGTIPSIDATLTQSGQAADAAAVGTALENVTVDVDATLTQSGQAADAKATGDAIGGVNERLGDEIGHVFKNINGLRIRTNNLFDKYNPDIKNIVANGATVNANSNARSVVIPVNITTQTNITVTRTVMSARFSVAKLTAYPNVGTPSSGVLTDNSAKSLTITVDSTIKYITVYFWLSTADTLTVDEILDGLMVEFGNTFTGYSDPYKLINQNQLDNLQNATADYATSEVSLTYVSATGYYAKNKAFSTYDGVTTATITVSEGEEYLLTTRNYYNAAIACLLDSNDAVNTAVWVANNTAEVKSYKITIPSGVSKLMVQRVYTYEPTKLKLVTGIKVKSVKSVLNGKRVTIIGDSITEKNSRAKTNWALWIKDWADPIVQNLGASGTGFIAGGNNPYHNRISRIDNPDIIGVALSFNDMSQTIEDLTTAAETFFDDLITAYPVTPIICYVQSPWSAYHPGVEKSDQWVAAMRNICAVRGIPFYDGMYYGSALRPWLAANRAVYYINDGEGNTGEEDWVHPNSEGHKIIARHLYPHFVENIVATD